MKKFLLLGSIVFLLIFTGCSHDEEDFKGTKFDVPLTRTTDDVADALATSALLQDLREYNISPDEKETLLYTIPIMLTSSALWNTNTIMI